MTSPESLESTRLEIEHRNPLQAVIITLMLKDRSSRREAQLEWVNTYGTQVSNIMDDPQHVEIREMARKGNYHDAAERVIELLND